MGVERFFGDTLLIPPYAAFLSLALLLFQWSVKGLSKRPSPIRLDDVEVDASLNEHISTIRVTPGRVITLFWWLRVVGCLGLLGLSLVSYRYSGVQESEPSVPAVPESALVFCFLYTTFLAAIPLIVKKDSTLVALHRNIVLLVTLVVYSYRDVYPLLTYTKEPMDKADGPLLWAKIGVLVLVAVVIPLFTPRQDYLSVQEEANPEQVASLASLFTYTFLDQVIFSTYKSPKFTDKSLPSLADYDAARYLKSQSFGNLDRFSGAKKSHIFWGMMKTFRWDYASLLMVSLVDMVTALASPVAINRLLNYIEKGGEGAVIRPWFWIALLFTGPFVHSLATNRYGFIAARLSVRIEAILTQLVFEHSLRIRPQSEKSAQGQDPKQKNSIGKMNNLITTDLANVIAARDFPKLLVQVPPRIALTIFFLYEVLGWSAFVGLAIIIVCMPIPGLVGKIVHHYQKEKMRRTDDRVSRVVEAVNLMRMIKLLGWEKRMQKGIHEKRVEEMEWSWKLTLSTLPIDTELLDAYVDEHVHEESALHREEIGFQNAKFTWEVKQDTDSSERNFVLHVPDRIVFKDKAINLIIGPTGSGKTSVLMALLGEMHCFTSNTPGSWFNLPRHKGVAYAAQESWIQNDTIKANILFDSVFDEERYQKVIHQCCLEHDLSLFEASDNTEVGELGVTLSGGQKARITLARAIYSNAEILLLDDVFAALDIHTAKWIVEKCFRGDLVKGRTILLVTHNLALTAPLTDYIVSVDLDGHLTGEETSGSKSAYIQDQIQKDEEHLEELEKMESEDALIGPTAGEKTQKPGNLIVEEEKEDGRVRWSTVAMYFKILGGKHPIIYYLCFFVPMILSNGFLGIQSWYLGYWASQYAIYPASEVNVLVLVTMRGSLRASRTIHARLMEAVFGSTFRTSWLDITPKSRIITRVTQDIDAIDGPLFQHIFVLWNVVSFMLIRLGGVVIYSPIFILPGITLAIIATWLSDVYMKTQVEIKREMSKARAPVLAHYGATIAGLPSIRAYGAQEQFICESLVRIDHYSRAARTFHCLTRWIALRMDLLSTMFVSALAIYLFYAAHQSSAATGFSLSMGASFSGVVLTAVQCVNTIEIQSNSLERIKQYLGIKQEPEPTTQGEPPAYWPASGSLRVEHLGAQYVKDGPEVLRDLSFEIRSGERIGIVGRTGAGKSSLTLALLRGIPTSGEVYYDGLPTSSLNLDALRSKVTIIPQVPELFNGTLRQNLDPFEEYDDATLNDALRAAGLQSVQTETEENRLTLDTTVSSGGANMSVGQRQILALARAIVRGSKLLILDEATSAIDYKTDTVIQQALRNELGKDVTLITVAHRLRTVMDSDKIMVLEDGKIVEFDTPKALIEQKSKLRSLVEESEDKDVLLAMIK
ncbi:hypothetical protein VNI00_008909 [Paramarasmius palmivorus]|uniref:P-loop containing nucleoside triphosphate hydrolase protein n=1 Tax=Paramarasmius palmivorus TaxID=297713 RepID=A0AAW0CS49_9AGAR